ncbi:MAG: hypothetical protein ACLGQH_01285 [Acidobacteriota bacterium]
MAFLLLLLATLAMRPLPARADPGVAMTGDARVYGLFFANRNFTGWDQTATRDQGGCDILQRLRLRTDFVAGEPLKFRFGLRIDDEKWGQRWGAGYLTAANPRPAVEPYLAYLQFKWPGTDIEATVGYQPFSLPQTAVFYDSVVLAGNDGDQASPVLAVRIPVVKDALAVEIAYGRLLDAYRTDEPTTPPVGNAFDVAFLNLPLTAAGIEATPWGLLGGFGKDADPRGHFAVGLRSAGSFLAPTGYRNNTNAMWWTGLALTATAFDPVIFSFDGIAGGAAGSDRWRNRRQGWFFDAGLTYQGLTWATPGLFAWIASGEDASLANGSERLPVISTTWGPGASFLFNCDQEFAQNTMGVDPTGTWGAATAIRDITVVEPLKSRLTLAVVSGRNSPSGLRKAVAATGGPGQYLSMGSNLAAGEWLLGLNWDHDYAISQALHLMLETGFASPMGLRSDIWGHRLTQRAAEAWMVSFGCLYAF